MNDPMARLPDAPDRGCGRLCQLSLVVLLLGGLTLWSMTLPLGNWHIPRVDYLPLHTVMEFLSVVAAFLVFATVWHTPKKEVSNSLVLLSLSLFAAGWLDLCHALSFKDMPVFITPSSPAKSIGFWLVARLLVAGSLLGYSLYPHLPPCPGHRRYRLLAFFALFVLLIFWLVVFHEDALPETFIAGSGITPFKINSERVITALLAVAAWRLWRLARSSRDESAPLLFGAAMLSLYCEIFLTQYATSNDLQNLLGHVFKVASYGLVYWGLLVVSVRKPYERLAEQTLALQSANATLQTQTLALESTATPVIVTDPQGRLRWRNPASMALIPARASAGEHGLSLFQAPFTPDPLVAADMRATTAQGGIWRGQVSIPDAQGNHYILNRVVTPLLNADGSVQGFVSVSENVTQSVQAHSRHKRVLETALDGFWIVDSEGRLLDANNAYARMSGYRIDELLGMHIRDLEALESGPEIQARMARIIQQGHEVFKTRHRHKLGHEISVAISVTCDPDTQHFFAFIRDTSEQDRAEQANRDLELQLQRAQKIQALGQLTGGIAHDFNNILAAILGYSSLALNRLVPDKQSKLAAYLTEVVSASERGRDLVAKLLVFTRTQVEANVGIVSVPAAIEEAVGMLRPSIPSGIVITTRIEANLPISVNPGELNQVLVNLIINARDALDGQGAIGIALFKAEVRDQVCAASQQRFTGTYLALEVSDNGCGISPAHRPRLFEPFFTTKEVGKGTGLGLSMVQGILRRAGGYLVLESQPGHGSCFRLLFPIASQIQRERDERSSASHERRGKGQHIWVLDDEPAVARYLGELLSDAGYSVKLFNDPAQLLAAFEAKKYAVDLLITDQTMPGMNGLALSRRVHRLQADLPIFLCTGYSDSIDPTVAQQDGIRQIFAKPLASSPLLKALMEVWPAQA